MRGSWAAAGERSVRVMKNRNGYVSIAAWMFCLAGITGAAVGQPLPGTMPMEPQPRMAEAMVAGIHRWLDRETASSPLGREVGWKPEVSSPEAFTRWARPRREQLARMIGATDPRLPFDALELAATTRTSATVGQGQGYTIRAVRWPVVAGVQGEGLLLEPEGGAVATLIVLPDADMAPEMLAGLSPGVEPGSQWGRIFAENGCRVVVPVLIDRSPAGGADHERGAVPLSRREAVFLAAYPFGRHIIGYEVQKVLALVDLFAARPAEATHPVALAGYGEGGVLALYAGAIDPRIDAVLVSGAIAAPQRMWSEPVYRHVWAQVQLAGGGELLSLMHGRYAVVEACAYPRAAAEPAGRESVFPGRLETPPVDEVRAEVARARRFVGAGGAEAKQGVELVLSGDGGGPFGSRGALETFWKVVGGGRPLVPAGAVPASSGGPVDPAARMERQYRQLLEEARRQGLTSPVRRRAFWADADGSSPERWLASTGTHRRLLLEEVIGRLGTPSLFPMPRSVQVSETPAYAAYQIMLDVHPDVFAGGVMVMPRALPEGEKAPVMVIMHDLEDQARDLLAEEGPAFERYRACAARLVDEGFIVLVAQGPVVGGDAWRQIDRKAQPLGLSLESFILRQHDALLRWLVTLPFVDGAGIAVMGFGQAAGTGLRVAAVLPGYNGVVCMGGFSERWLAGAVDPSLHRLLATYAGGLPGFGVATGYGDAEAGGLIAPRPLLVAAEPGDPAREEAWMAFAFAEADRRYAAMSVAERIGLLRPGDAAGKRMEAVSAMLRRCWSAEERQSP